MKAYIGKYVHRWTTHQVFNKWLEWRHKKDYWEVDESDYTLLDRLVEKFLDGWQWVLNHSINLIQDRRERKIKVRIDYWDTFAMDNTLTPIILPMLKQIKENKQGAPFVDADDAPEHLRPPAGFVSEGGDVDDNHFDRWDWILDEMIWAFEQLNSDWEAQFHTGKIHFEFKPLDDGSGMTEMVKGANDTHHFDSKGHLAHSKRIDNGLLLFGKYFRNLWD
jgi:hypothetical protein